MRPRCVPGHILVCQPREGTTTRRHVQPGDEAKPGEKYAKGAQRRRESKRGKAPDAAILASIARKGNDASHRSQPGDEARGKVREGRTAPAREQARQGARRSDTGKYREEGQRRIAPLAARR